MPVAVPKQFVLHGFCAVQVYEISTDPPTTPHFAVDSYASVASSIAAAHFTGTGDRETVLDLYRDYKRRLQQVRELAKYSRHNISMSNLSASAAAAPPAEPPSFIKQLSSKVTDWWADFLEDLEEILHSPLCGCTARS